MRKLADRAISIFTVLILGLLGANIVLSYSEIRQVYDSSAWVVHTHKVLETLEQLNAGIANIQASEKEAVLTHLDILQDLVRDNAPQLESTVQLKNRVVAWMPSVDPHPAPLLAQVRQMADEESQLLDRRTRHFERIYHSVLFSRMIANILAFIMTASFFYIFRSYLMSRSRAEKSLFEEKELFRTTIASIGDGVVTTDVQGNVTFLNSLAESLMGWTPKEAEGRYIDEVFTIVNQGTRQPVDTPVVKVLREKKIMTMTNDTILIGKNGMETPIEDSAAPIKDKEGDIIGVVMVFRDVSEKKKKEALLRESEARYHQLADDLARSNKELEQFSFIVSHDLKEPLVMISSYTDLLVRRSKDKLAPKEIEYLRAIKKAALQGNALVKEVLHFSRIGRTNSAEIIDLNASINNIRGNLEHLIEGSKASIECADLPSIKGNPVETGRLFQNLIQNAIKYRSKESPVIRIAALKAEDGKWLFSVKDNGMGISPSDQERIFRLFERSDSKSAGTGIGLAICKKIIEKNGGRIWVESQPGKGSSFYFTWPRLE